jgi:hypothetical protein
MAKYLGSGAAYGVFEKQVISPDGLTTEFTLTYQVGHSSSILVISDGVVQEPNFAYALIEGGRKIAFSYPPLVAERIYIVYLGREISVPAVSGNYCLRIRLEAPTLNGTTTTFDLSSLGFLPPDLGLLREEGMTVFLNKVPLQFGNDWTLNVSPDFKVGNAIIFNSAPSGLSIVDIYVHAVERSDIKTVDAASITGDKLANNITIGSPSNKCEAIYVKNLVADNPITYINSSEIELKTHSGFTQSGHHILTNAVMTTDSSPTILWNFELPNVPSGVANSAIWFEIDMVGLNVSADENCWINIKGGAKRNVIATSLVGIQQNISGTDSSDYNAFVQVSGTNVQVMVVGHPSNTVHWAATIRYQAITSVAL